MPRLRRFNQLKRPNIRQNWNKANLYNLSRFLSPHVRDRTFFQQKWTAKSLLRAYHNPDVREGTWTRLFDRRMPAVVPMDARYLAQYDGSEQAEGRGSGRDVAPPVEDPTARRSRDREQQPLGPPRTPFAHMTFHPLERRLDTAIFRAMFASSTRQARQFVVHGWVKVNGKKMQHPSYMLNPGDMFQVDPERVMYATGATKAAQEAEEGKEAEEGEEAAESEEAEGEKAEETKPEEPAPAPLDPVAAQNAARSALRKLLDNTKTVLGDAKGDLSGKRLKELRNLSRDVKKLLSQYRGVEEEKLDDSVESLRSAFTEILGKLPEDTLSPEAAAKTGTASPDAAHKSSNPQAKDPKVVEQRARREAAQLAAAIERIRENPYDPSKPYATPWRPRPYMSAFAFIPRYLEVNHNICSAVYLRHPVARPGLAEVPTPFSAETMALAYNWYLRRR